MFIIERIKSKRLRPAITSGLTAICYVLLFSACNVTKHLDTGKGERLLTKNSLDIVSDKKFRLGEKAALLYEMGSLYKQQPNERTFFLFRSRLWFYYRFVQRGDTRLGSWMLQKVAEQPAIYDDELAQQTATNFQNFMRQRGYFQAECTYSTFLKGKSKAETSYRLELGPLYKIDQLRFVSPDSNVQRILHKTADKSVLSPGSPLDARLFDAEKLRITTELKNNGYAFFVPNFVEFSGDSTGNKALIDVEVLPPNDTALHKVYTVKDVTVYSRLVPDLSPIRREDTIGGVLFLASDAKLLIRPERLYREIAIRPGAQYRQEDFDKTAHNLNALGVFRFVSIKPYQDSLSPDKINTAISFVPNKRIVYGSDFGLNYSTSAVTGGLAGISAGVFFLNRNLRRGAESLQSNLGYNVEFDVQNRKAPIFSQEIKFQNDLTIPRFIDYFGLWKNMKNLRGEEKRGRLLERMRAEGRTRISLTYDYINQTSFFLYNLFNAKFGYELSVGKEHIYTFDHVGVDILKPELRSYFRDSIANPLLLQSFSDRLFTGVLLRSFSYTYAGQPNRFGEHWFFQFNFDNSGVEEHLLNNIWSAAFGKQDWRAGNLAFAKYLRGEVSGSYTRDFTRHWSGAVRIGAGIIKPFGDTSGAPYVKQFFVGGPSSIRAWRIRELGPGGYIDDKAFSAPFYQASDFRFEFSGELRFPLFWWFKGAVFLDGGNIWSLRTSDKRPDARLSARSYKNIALGTGFGVRADFDYFILRFDWGLKLRKPYVLNDQDQYWIDWTNTSWKQLSNFNLAVGYPF